MANDLGYVKTMPLGEWAAIEREMRRLREIERLARAVRFPDNGAGFTGPSDRTYGLCWYRGCVGNDHADDCPWRLLGEALGASGEDDDA